MELLWYGIVVGYVLGSAMYLGFGYRMARRHDCRTLALMLSRQIAGTSPPVFEVVYRCPTCREILSKRFVSVISD
jgi:hypothetical protein